LNHPFTSLFAIHETLWNHAGCQKFVTLAELLEGYPSFNIIYDERLNFVINCIVEQTTQTKKVKNLLGNPCLQILIPSSTPLHLSWSRTRVALILPPLLSWLGIMHRTKLGFVFLRVSISFANCSL